MDDERKMGNIDLKHFLYSADEPQPKKNLWARAILSCLYITSKKERGWVSREFTSYPLASTRGKWQGTLPPL